MSSTTVTSSILERARVAQAAHIAECQRYQAKRIADDRMLLAEEWKPIVDSVLAQIRAQLGDEGEITVIEDDETGKVYYFGAGWCLVRPSDKPLDRDYDRSSTYVPLKLTIGDDIRTPVMCWSDGRTRCKFEPASIAVDVDADPVTLWVGASAETVWGIDNGSDDLLLAIAHAADKQGEYVTKAHQVELINMERSKQRTNPEPAPQPVKTDPLETAGRILERFAGGLYCTPGFDYSVGSEIAYEDNRAFLIASQIHALAVEVRELRNTMENRP